MKAILTLMFIINVATAGVFWKLCPGDVAIHFGVNGQPDSWAPAWVNFLIITGANLLIFLLMGFAGILVKVTPSKFVNLPNKDYWLSEKHKASACKKLTKHSCFCGALTLGLLLICTLLAMQANLSQPPIFNQGPFLLALGIYFFCMIMWVINFYSDFRLPKND